MGANRISRPLAVGITIGIALLAFPKPARGQGSWLPYGTSGAFEIGVSSKGVVWTIGKEPGSIRTLLTLGETSFVSPPGTPSRVAADPNGFAWVVNSKGDLWHWIRGSTGKEDWAQSSQKAIDIAVGANGSVWALGTDQRVWRLSGNTWETIGGAAGVRIAVDPTGNPWVVNTEGQIWKYSGTSWSLIDGRATDIAIAPDGGVFILGMTRALGGFEVLRLNGTGWEHILGGGGVAIAAGPNGVYVAQDATVLTSTYSRLRINDHPPTGPTSLAAKIAPTDVGTPILSAEAAKSTQTTQAGKPIGVVSAVADATQATTAPGAATAAAAGGGGFSLGALGRVVGAAAGAAEAAAGVAGAAAGVAEAKVGAAEAAVRAGKTVVGAGEAAVGMAGTVSTVAGSIASLPHSLPGSLSKAGDAAVAGTPAPNGAAVSGTQAVDAAAASGSPLSSVKNLVSSGLSAVRAISASPVPGKLLCPDLAAKAHLDFGCALVGRAALQLGPAPSTDCAAPAFADSQNGGECWTCPNLFVRNTGSARVGDACMNADSADLGGATHPRYAVATVATGCSLYKGPPGYGTAFRDPRNGGECWVCPSLLERAWSAVNSVANGMFGSCVGAKNLRQIVWQLTQYPEPGAYRFMPGLLSIALNDPKAVDDFLSKRANGDSDAKRALWANMIANPAGSAELKALLFASLLTVAKQDNPDSVAKDALTEFESYMRARRTFLAEEAVRMHTKWNEVDALWSAAHSKGVGGIAADAVGAAVTNFKSYAWSAAMPDSAGTAFVLATASLSQLDASRTAGTVMDSALSSLNVAQLERVTQSLEKGLAALQGTRENMLKASGTLSRMASAATALKSAERGMIGASILSGATGFIRSATTLLHRDQTTAEYEKYLAEMETPVKVKELLESTEPRNQEMLLLFWSLATSPHKASDELGTGFITSDELCTVDGWTAATCSSAKTMVAAAAKAAGY